MRVEKLSEAYFPEWETIEKECFSDPWSARSIEYEARRESACYLGLFCEERLAGYAGMYAILDEGYITNVAISEKHRRRHGATMLIEALIAEAEKRKLAFLTLEVRQSNLPAIGLYASLGFKQAGRRKGYYAKPAEDALIMTLRLPRENA